MAVNFVEKIRRAWNAFTSDDASHREQIGSGNGTRPDRARLNQGNEKSIIAGIYTRIGIDVAGIQLRHVRLDENDRYVETITSGLNECFALEANIDQSARHFIQDVAMALCDDGSVGIVPVQTTVDPKTSQSYDVLSLRAGKITSWHPQHIKIDLYNDRTGLKQQLTLPKHMVGIVENPLYSVMNEPNSTLQRLIRKLNLLDTLDSRVASGKLDMVVQVPYTIKTPARQLLAAKRREELETQLSGSKYGIAYLDGTEKITQLNRPVENNLIAEIDYLTKMLYSQLGLTEAVFAGSANEQEMLNYYNRTVLPITNAIADSMKRKFLSKTARAQRQSIRCFRDPFGLAPVGTLADLVDKFTRNAVLSSNEFRSIMGFKKSNDPEADALRNKNLNAEKGGSTSQEIPPAPQEKQPVTTD